MQVEHELRDRPMEPRQLAPHERKARAGELARDLEVEPAQGLAQLEVLLGLELEAWQLADTAELQIGALVLAVGHVLGGNVGQAGEDIVQLFREAARLLLLARHGLLELGHLGHEGARLVVAALAFSRTDGFRGFVAALLHILQQAERLAVAAIEIDDGAGLRRQAAPANRPVEVIGTIADPLEIEHGTPSSAQAGTRVPLLFAGPYRPPHECLSMG